MNNLSLVTITVLLTAAAESASGSGRVLHWGQHNQGGQGGRGKDILAKLQGMVDTECNSDFVCPESVMGCDEIIDKPERPLFTWWNMSEEEKAEAKAEMEVKKDTFKEQVLTCACCDGKTVEELVGYDQGGQGGRGEDILVKLQGMVDTECNSDFVCPESVTGCDEIIDKPERPLLTWWNMSEEEKAEAKAEMEAKKDTFKEQVLTCACCDGKTVEELVGHDRIRVYDEDSSGSSLDEEGSESSSSSQDDGSEDIIGEDTDLSSLPGQATSIARASAAVDGLDIQSNAAGQAGISWAFVFAVFGIASWAL